MSLLKFAYVRGAQNALVSAGAIQPYASEYKADLAVKLAALAIEDESTEEVTDEELAQALAAMASNAEEELSAEDAKKLMEAAEDGSEELEALMEDSEGEEMSEEDAREVVAYLKSAAAQGQISGVANPKPKNPGDFQTESGARASDAYGHLNGRQGPDKNNKNAVPFTASMKPLREGVSIDAKTAAAILRKLSGDAAGPGSANAIGGDGTGGSSSDYQTEDDPRKNPAYGNEDQGLEEGDSNATPNTGKMTSLKDNNSENLLDLGSSGSKNAAYNFLLYKTAEEVGPFLPTNLADTDKVAALRAMIGMTQPERAQYIQRIKWAMDEADEGGEKEEATESDEDKYLEPEQKSLPAEIKKKIIAKAKGQEKEEKTASRILGQLGLGY